MAKKRRVRISANWSSGGRAGLIGSLLPTAQDTADAKAVLQIQDNEKVTAFNNDEITFGQLEAYFLGRLAASQDSIDKARLNSMLTAAKTAENKKAQAAAISTVKSALDNFQNGDGDYESVIQAIEAADGQVKDQTARDALDQARRGARQIKVSREVTAAITAYNNGGKYEDAKKILQDVLASETNEQLKTQIGTSLKAMREAENNRAMTLAANAYATTGDINAYVKTLSTLRDSPDQTNPDSLQKISAAIEAGLINEQTSIDSKKYTAWQTHQITDQEALQYFQGRLATARNPKEVEYLGKYAANIQQSMDNALKAAQSRAAGVARGASSAANAAVARQDSLSKFEFDYFEKNTFKDMLKAAGTDPVKISAAFDVRKALLVGPPEAGGTGGLVGQGGYYASEYALFAKLNELERRSTISSVLWDDYQGTQAANLKATIGAAGKGLSVGEFTTKNLEIADKAAGILTGEFSKYFSDSQKKAAWSQRNDALQAIQYRLDMDAAGRRTAEGTVRARVTDVIGPNALTLAKKLGIAVPEGPSDEKTEDKTARVMQSLADWILQDPQTRITQVYHASAEYQDKKLMPGDASKFTEDFMKVFQGTQSGKVLGGDPDYRASYVAFLQAAYPNSFRSVFANGMIYDGETGKVTEDLTPEAMRRMRLVERMAEQPFRGSEIGASPDDPNPPKMVILDAIGEPARPQFKPIARDQIPTMNEDGVPYTPAMQAFIAASMAMGDTFDNAGRAARMNADWWGQKIQYEMQEFAQRGFVAPGSPADELGKLWSDVFPGPGFSYAGASYQNLWQDALKKGDEVAHTKVGPDLSVLAGQVGETTEETLDTWGQFTQQRADQWQDLTSRRAEEWSRFATDSWKGIEDNLINTWSGMLALLGGAEATEPEIDINQPTWGGWDSMTSDAQAAIQELIDAANAPDFAPTWPGEPPAVEPAYPEISPTPVEEFQIPLEYNEPFDWSGIDLTLPAGGWAPPEPVGGQGQGGQGGPF